MIIDVPVEVFEWIYGVYDAAGQVPIINEEQATAGYPNILVSLAPYSEWGYDLLFRLAPEGAS